MSSKAKRQLPVFPIAATMLLAFFQIFSFAVSAQGNLLITPKRVVFDGTRRSEDLNLANIGTDTATYMISFIQIRMKEDGSFERIEKPDTGQLFAEPYLRIFPRTVTLAPNEAQAIKLQVRRTPDMQPGEYRSHIYFRAIPRQKPLGERTVEKDSTISVKLTPVFGISIPVIVRVGEANAQVQVQETALLDSSRSLRVSFERQGNTSVYGDITVNYISKQGKLTKVGMAKGFAIYTPNTRRFFDVKLDGASPVDLHSGKLQVLYTDQSSRPVTLAEKELELK